MSLEQLNRLEELAESNHYLRVQRCIGDHCIGISPCPHETKKSHSSIKAIQDGIKSGQWPGLKLENNYQRHNMYEIKVCIDMGRILSDKIENHYDDLHLQSRPYED